MEQKHHIEGIYTYYIAIRLKYPRNSYKYHRKFTHVWVLGETKNCYIIKLKSNSVRGKSIGEITRVLKKNVTILPPRYSC